MRRVYKNYYELLGVGPTSTSAAIRDAYLQRVRATHPDRLDPESQPEQWARANDVLAELNEAYAVLKSPDARRKYDAWHSAQFDKGQEGRQETSGAPRSTAPPFEYGQLTRGVARLVTLPELTRQRLVDRQNTQDNDQIMVATGGIGWNVTLLMTLPSWLLFLIQASLDPRWGAGRELWYGIVTLGVALLAGINLMHVVRWKRSTLRSYFYVTRLYYIFTEQDVIRFYPIWTVKNTSIVHHYSNAFYRASSITFDFGANRHEVWVRSKKRVEQIVERIEDYRVQIMRAYDRGDSRYFVANDDFYNVPRSSALGHGANSKYGLAVRTCLACLVVATVVFAGSSWSNQVNDAGWHSHERPPRVEKRSPLATLEVAPSKAAVERSVLEKRWLASHPVVALPKHGETKLWGESEQIAPFEIESTGGGYYLLKLVDVSTREPVMTIFVHGGRRLALEVPLGAYEVRYATGTAWYGYEYLFGPRTQYSRAEGTFEFAISGNHIGGYSLTLFEVRDGNLKTVRMSAEDF